jgi:hypothetical protein
LAFSEGAGKGSERCRERIYASRTKEEERPYGKEKSTAKEKSTDQEKNREKEKGRDKIYR